MLRFTVFIPQTEEFLMATTLKTLYNAVRHRLRYSEEDASYTYEFRKDIVDADGYLLEGWEAKTPFLVMGGA